MASENTDVVVYVAKEEEEQVEFEVSKKLEIAEEDGIYENDEAEGNIDLEMKLITLISQLRHPRNYLDSMRMKPLVIQIISLVRYMDLDSLPKPESKIISLISQTISVFNTMDFDSMPEPLSKLISFFSEKISSSYRGYGESVGKTLDLEPHMELISLIRQIISIVVFMNSKSKKFIFLCPQVRVSFHEGKFHPEFEDISSSSGGKWNCFFGLWKKFNVPGEEEEEASYFRCIRCNGEYHQDYEKAPLVIRHSLHSKHSLHLVLNVDAKASRECYCCDEELLAIFYYCSVCDYAMNISCVKKEPVIHIEHLKWHDHKLAHFPRGGLLICNVCGLANSNCSPVYTCPPCDFLVHRRCTKLPRVIQISRHLHRLYFTQSSNKGGLFCGVCRRKIDNEFGSFSCIKDCCSYGVHSKCATQRNVWDGIDLEGVPEEIEEEELEPFVRISDGIIRHFSHEHHHLRLDENIDRDYDENKLCQACVTPIYFGNFYSCLQCEFVLHEKCANLSRKIYHPVHPHMLTLALGPESLENRVERCSVCYRLLAAGFFYVCGKENCTFQLHVQCATISEPLVHESHVHSLFLTSKPGERRRLCCFCRKSTEESFNCIECDDFALCFSCATLPSKVRYKHDKHILTLSYGEETSTIIYWCEACEKKIDPRERFYMCDEYCCVTLHIECLIGRDLYMKPDLVFLLGHTEIEVQVQRNNHMSRPICFYCGMRCPQKYVFEHFCGYTFCSVTCLNSW